jgi:hypothetical protein
MRPRAAESKHADRCGVIRLTRSVGLTDQTKEEGMHPLIASELAQQHIADLHREAALQRRTRSSKQTPSRHRKVSVARLQRAPAH